MKQCALILLTTTNKQWKKYNNKWYPKVRHLELLGFIGLTALVGSLLSFAAFGFMLRRGETFLRPVVVLTSGTAGVLFLCGLIIGEYFMAACGAASLLVFMLYSNVVWPRIAVSRKDEAVPSPLSRALHVSGRRPVHLASTCYLPN